ncbi:MAG TPA: acetyl-CoA carboxylase biotin carboxylase subunit, partial [Candidatus Tectomicrobia bacterium]|nr:acetyl-CoA carboxylase biotin carboxylase subunit [Candidatus Tectomicrobia bacterium]
MRIRKLLVANRGEIAVRVIRACREQGIATVAVYSEADREALHVLMADEAYPIGPPPAAESYLAIDTLVATARRAGADAVHPGYGFLAENAAFAQACADAGLTFVGPPPAAIRAMGDKTAARRIAQETRVPMVPGTMEPLASDDEARAQARALGYPVMLKAAMGGGGKGMRLVRSEAELGEALRAARAEAGAAFGDASVYLERAVAEPRHVEIQVLADAHGGVVHLGERECSIQRRHQKLVEECPSPAVDASLRARMGVAACRIARAAGYVNAGTVEFLLDADGRFYFLEMNTRLQVEHPVTEMVTGIDVVREQLRIAAGEPLGYGQADVTWRGAAIECRINAEDPFAGWLPSPGRISALRPASGPWVRDDSGVYEGATIPRWYDTLIAKLIVWGPDRAAAIARMGRALAEYRVAGVRTTIPVLERIVADPDFRDGRL